MWQNDRNLVLNWDLDVDFGFDFGDVGDVGLLRALAPFLVFIGLIIAHT